MSAVRREALTAEDALEHGRKAVSLAYSVLERELIRVVEVDRPQREVDRVEGDFLALRSAFSVLSERSLANRIDAFIEPERILT